VPARHCCRNGTELAKCLRRSPRSVLQGRTQEGADGAKAPPEIKKKFIIYSFKYAAFYVLQFCTKKSVCVVCTLSKMHGHIKSK